MFNELNDLGKQLEAMSHKRGFRNDINYTNFITKMIYDLVYEKQMFWVKIHGFEVYKL